MSIELQPIREWQEKDGDKVLKTIRLYVGGLHVATVEPSKEDPFMYHFESMLDVIRYKSDTHTMEDIKTHIELSLKEFIAKMVKPRKLVKMEAPPSKKFNSPLKKDGNGKR